MSLILTLILLLVAAPAQAAIAHVQTVSCSSHAVASCTTPSITSTTGNLFVVSTSWGYASLTSFTSITDSQSNTYANAIADTPSDGGSGDVVARQDYKANGTGGSSHTFTGTIGAAYHITISALEISGADTSLPLDKTATGSDFATSHTTASTATTAQANEYIIGFGVSIDTTTYTIGGTFTERTNIAAVDLDTSGLVVGDKIVSATGTYAFDFTTGAGDIRTASGISTWKEAAAAGGGRQRCVGCGSDPKVIE